MVNMLFKCVKFYYYFYILFIYYSYYCLCMVWDGGVWGAWCVECGSDGDVHMWMSVFVFMAGECAYVTLNLQFCDNLIGCPNLLQNIVSDKTHLFHACVFLHHI